MEHVATQTLIFCADYAEWNGVKQRLLVKLLKHVLLERDLADTANDFEYTQPQSEQKEEKEQKEQAEEASEQAEVVVKPEAPKPRHAEMERTCMCGETLRWRSEVGSGEANHVECTHCRSYVTVAAKGAWRCDGCVLILCDDCYCAPLVPLCLPAMSIYAYRQTLMLTLKPIFLLCLFVDALHKIIKPEQHFLQYNADAVLKELELLLDRFDNEWMKMESFAQFEETLKAHGLVKAAASAGDEDADVQMKGEETVDETTDDMEWIETLCGMHHQRVQPPKPK